MLKNKKRLVCILNTENPIVSREVDGFRREFEQVLFNYLPNLFIFMFFFQKLIGILERDYTLAAECPMIYQMERNLEFCIKYLSFASSEVGMCFIDQNWQKLGVNNYSPESFGRISNRLQSINQLSQIRFWILQNLWRTLHQF